jgi:protein SCO1/2
MHARPSLRRRALLTTAAGWALASVAGVAGAHGTLGPVEPRRPAPNLALTLHDGRKTTLPRLLQGRWTALQLMFTGCSASCPVQGAVFGALQGLVLDSLPGAQLLSISVDPLSDDAPALARWRRGFGAGPAWAAGSPPVVHGDVMLDFLAARNTKPGGSNDRHRAEVTLFDREGRLAFRCAELASASDIARAMRELAALDSRGRR